MLLGEGYRLLAGLNAKESVRLELLATAATLQRDLCIGQGREFEMARGALPATVEDLFRIAAGKTGKAFEAALAFGLICAGGYESLRAFVAEFSARLGVAYQLRDDLADDAETRLSPVSFLRIMCRDEAWERYRAEREGLFALMAGLEPPALKLLLFQIVGKVLPPDRPEWTDAGAKANERD